MKSWYLIFAGIKMVACLSRSTQTKRSTYTEQFGEVVAEPKEIQIRPSISEEFKLSKLELQMSRLYDDAMRFEERAFSKIDDADDIRAKSKVGENKKTIFKIRRWNTF